MMGPACDQDAARLIKVQAIRNVEGEVVITVESPTMRWVGFLTYQEAKQLAEAIRRALERRFRE